MKEFIISHQEEGQRFDKYLVKCLPKAQKSFLYKMLRKKNIVLNGKKADGNEKIKAGDSVKIFFSDETFEKFSDEKTSVKIAAVSDEVKLDVESLNDLLKSEFITGALTDGEIDFYICINGLPYTKITKEISKYIKINELLIPDEITLYNGEERELVIDANPSNYTNKLFEIISDNDSVTINNKLIKGNKVGSANVTVKNKDITKQIKINVLERLTSNVFEINYSDHTIFVSSMTQKNINKNDFLSRLRGVVSNYKILDKNNNNITSMVTNIGTNMSLVNGNETYKIIVIGDLNGDGKINVFDVSMLYNYVRGKTSLDKYTLKAAAIRKQNQIKVADVSKLYSFVRDRISGI